VLEVKEIKTVPYVPLSHPFVERPIGTVRRECLDRTLFWTTTDLEAKLFEFQHYYNGQRTHAGLNGRLPESAINGSASMSLVRTGGGGTVEGCTRLQLGHDFQFAINRVPNAGATDNLSNSAFRSAPQRPIAGTKPSQSHRQFAVQARNAQTLPVLIDMNSEGAPWGESRALDRRFDTDSEWLGKQGYT
jgi:hypothetical protein